MKVTFPDPPAPGRTVLEVSGLAKSYGSLHVFDSVEFDVDSVQAVSAAAEELERAGFEVVHAARTEPWGQTVARVISSEGLIVGVSYAPWLHP